MRKKQVVFFLTALFGMPIVAVGVLTATKAFYPNDLPVMGVVPAFSFTDRSGKEVSSEDLKGHVYLANFIFTSCSAQCPIITKRMSRLVTRFRFKDRMRFISFTVDPDTDTPKRLAHYAASYQADPYKWYFLTAETEENKQELRDIVNEGFKLPRGEGEGGDIIHSFYFVLVDGWGQIRGYYDGENDLAEGKLKRDIKKLVKATPAPL